MVLLDPPQKWGYGLVDGLVGHRRVARRAVLVSREVILGALARCHPPPRAYSVGPVESLRGAILGTSSLAGTHGINPGARSTAHLLLLSVRGHRFAT